MSEVVQFKTWVSLSFFCAQLLVFCVSLLAGNARIFLGGVYLNLVWVVSVASTQLIGDMDPYYFWLPLDASGAIVFYRLAERDAKTGKREDWAAFICFAFIAMIFVSIQRILFGDNHAQLYLGTLNIITALTLIIFLTAGFGAVLLRFSRWRRTSRAPNKF